jgi:MFS transporter, UMF1 family
VSALLHPPQRNNRPDALARSRSGWYAYDWANSAFAVTILAALFGPYLDKVVVPAAGYSLPLPGMQNLSATSLYGYALGLSALLVFATSPLLGAIADQTRRKKRFLMFFAGVGAGATIAMGAIGPGDVALALLLFMIANFSFVSANVFYDSFLPHIAEPHELDVVSGRGYAWGYAGGGIIFVLQLLLVQFHESFGITSAATAVRMSLTSAGLWWGGFSLLTWVRLDESELVRRNALPHAVAQNAAHGSAVPGALTLGLRRIAVTMRAVASLPNILLFLLAFMIYNDGIQTTIAMATVYGSEELGFDTLTLMGCLLMVQFVGIAGARSFSFIANRTSTKTAITISLSIWSVVVLYAYGMSEPWEFWLLGAIVGLVLGGSQALSRSFFSRIIPSEASAEFFGFFSVFEKFSAIAGPVLFALIRQVTGTSRLAILSLLLFFVVGMVLLAFVNVGRAREEGRSLDARLH